MIPRNVYDKDCLIEVDRKMGFLLTAKWGLVCYTNCSETKRKEGGGGNWDWGLWLWHKKA